MKEKLNIVLLSAANPINDSGGLINDMYRSLSNDGHSVIIITRNYNNNLTEKMNYVYYSNNKFVRCLRRNIWGYLQIRYTRTNPLYYMISVNEKIWHVPTKKILSKVPFKPDVFIYTHPHQFLDSRNLYELNQLTKAPIFMVPVDIAAFTGGCHYANDCQRYANECGCCPGLYSNNPHDFSHKTLMHKKKYISKTDIYMLTNTWTLNYAKKSSLYSSKPCFELNAVINEKIFKSGNKEFVRQKYNIPGNKSVILFGANKVDEKRKGLSYLFEALNKLSNEMTEKEKSNTIVVIMGKVANEIFSIPFDSYSLGYITPACLPEIYQMADVYVSPSIQDAGPMMVIQSLMCETPVVCFEMGNAENYIFNGETGYKVPLYDAEQLKNGIRFILNCTTEEKQRISKKCREVAVSKSSYKAFSDNISRIFSSIELINYE
jgi:glycosyltransferase involved in cell wall biosynthesis